MSSRYSRSPTSFYDYPIGFINEIYSTSPYKIKNRLCSKSMPFDYKRSQTSLNVDSKPLRIYFE